MTSRKPLRAKKILVYCGSRLGNSQIYACAMDEFTTRLREEEAEVIFGGSDMGLMHLLCESSASKNIKITGVIPEKFYKKGIAFQQCTELIVSNSLHERKAIMEKMADGIICFPGGVGSLDEFMSSLANKQIGELHSPLVLLNLEGYYDKLIELLCCFIDAGFAGEKIKKNYYAARTIQEVFAFLKENINS